MLKIQTLSISTVNSKLMLQKTGRVAFSLLRAIFLIAMCFVVIYPVLYMITLSLRETVDLYDTSVIWIPKHWTTQNYRDVIEMLDYWQMLLKTLALMGVSTALNVAICAVTGYGFARYDFRGRALLFGLVLFTIIVPPQNVAIPLFMQYYSFDFLGLGQIAKIFGSEAISLNLLNTSWTFYLPAAFGMGLRSGIFIYIFRQFFRGMPVELEDASYIDGCNIFKTFIRIMLPNAGPAILTSFMFSFVWYWNDYYLGTLFFDKAPTLSVALGSYQSSLLATGLDASDPYAIYVRLQAGCVLLILPLIIGFAILQRKFTESIDKTGIVG